MGDDSPEAYLSKWQLISVADHHFYPTRAWDLMTTLKRLYLLGWEDLASIMKFLLYDDKFIVVEKIGPDERIWNLYLFPRTPNLIKYPHSFMPLSYYEEMRDKHSN